MECMRRLHTFFMTCACMSLALAQGGAKRHKEQKIVLNPEGRRRNTIPLQEDVQGMELHANACYDGVPGLHPQEGNKAYLRNLSCEEVHVLDCCMHACSIRVYM